MDSLWQNDGCICGGIDKMMIEWIVWDKMMDVYVEG